MLAVANFSSLMEVGVGLSLSFAVIERVRGTIREKRIIKTREKLTSLEASTEHKQVISDEVGDILQVWEKRTRYIEDKGAFVAFSAVLILLFQLTYIGFEPKAAYCASLVFFSVLLPSFIMPILVMAIYTSLGLLSYKVDKCIETYKKSLDDVRALDAKACELDTEAVSSDNRPNKEYVQAIKAASESTISK